MNDTVGWPAATTSTLAISTATLALLTLLTPKGTGLGLGLEVVVLEHIPLTDFREVCDIIIAQAISCFATVMVAVSCITAAAQID